MYLELCFHDNDFHNDIINVLEKLWNYINDDREQYSQTKKKRTVAEAFEFLHEMELLEPIIKKMMILSAAEHDAEWATRGICLIRDAEINIKLNSAIEDVSKLESYFDKITGRMVNMAVSILKPAKRTPFKGGN